MTDAKTEQPTGEAHEAPEESDEVTYASDYKRLKATQVEWLAFLGDRTILEIGSDDKGRAVLESTKHRVRTIWNAWRAEQAEDFHPDLYETDCRKFFLEGAHLKNANLRGAHLENADLLLADLEYADLSYAHLENALLKGAHLENAERHQAHLEHANLEGARLENAKLQYVTFQTGPEEGEKRDTEATDDAEQKKPVPEKRGIDLNEAVFCRASPSRISTVSILRRLISVTRISPRQT